MPSWFARQFGYDQCYVGNPSHRLSYEGSLIDNTQGWYWYIAGCTGAKFVLPQREPALRTSLAYCKWHKAANTFPSGYNLGTSGLTEIKVQRGSGHHGPQQDDDTFAGLQDEEPVREVETREVVAEFRQEPAAESQVEEYRVELQPSTTTEVQAEVSAGEAQLKLMTELQVEGSGVEPPTEKPAPEFQAEPEKDSREEESHVDVQEESSAAADTETEPEELTRAGEALERVRDLVAGRVRMPEFASPKLKGTVKYPRRADHDLAEGPSKKSRLESPPAPKLISPTPAAESTLSEGMYQCLAYQIPIVFVVSMHVLIMCFCRQHGRPFD